MSRPGGRVTAGERATPETYLGAARAEGFTTPPVVGTRNDTSSGDVGASEFSLGGTWTVDDESATAGRDAVLRARVLGKDVYLVLSGPGTVRVTVDGALREDRARDVAGHLHAALAALDRAARDRAALLRRRLRLRVHVRVIRRCRRGVQMARAVGAARGRGAEHAGHELARHRDPRTGQARQLLDRVAHRLPAPTPTDGIAALTDREREVLQLIAGGLSTRRSRPRSSSPSRPRSATSPTCSASSACATASRP